MIVVKLFWCAAAVGVISTVAGLLELRRGAAAEMELNAASRAVAQLSRQPPRDSARSARIAAASPRPEAPPSGGAAPVRSAAQLARAAESASAALRSQYSLFCSQLGLSKADAVRFEALKAAENRGLLDLAEKYGTTRITAANPEAFAELQRVQSQFRDSLAATLGPDAPSKLDTYERAAPARSMVTDLAVEATHLGSPLDAKQAAALVAIITQTDPGFSGTESFDPRRANWDDAMRSAGSILDPGQLTTLQLLVQKRQADSDLQAGLRSSRAKSRGGS